MADAHAVNKLVQFHPIPNDYQLITVIGRGCNGQAPVSVAKHLPSGTLVAVKCINLEKCDLDVHSVQHEVFVYNSLQHECILPLLCSFVHKNEIWIVSPLMAYGSSNDLLQAYLGAGIHGLPEPVIAFIMKDVLQALDYMHQRGVVHRNVRASHILISAKGHICLSGLRFAQSMLENGTRLKHIHHFPSDHYVASLCHASPELLEQNLAGYDTKSDIYSIGVAACELANGIVPFSDVQPTQMLLEKLEGLVPRLLDTYTLPELQDGQDDAGQAQEKLDTETPNHNGMDTSPYQRTFSQHFHDFVEICTLKEPAARPTASALLQHTFFKQIRRKSMSESLTDLLKFPPITDMLLEGHLSEQTCASGGQEIDNLTDQLNSVEMDENWTF